MNKRVSVVLVLAALVLIAVVIWAFDKRIERVENRVESPSLRYLAKN